MNYILICFEKGCITMWFSRVFTYPFMSCFCSSIASYQSSVAENFESLILNHVCIFPTFTISLVFFCSVMSYNSHPFISSEFYQPGSKSHLFILNIQLLDFNLCLSLGLPLGFEKRVLRISWNLLISLSQESELSDIIFCSILNLPFPPANRAFTVSNSVLVLVSVLCGKITSSKNKNSFWS